MLKVTFEYDIKGKGRYSLLVNSLEEAKEQFEQAVRDRKFYINNMELTINNIYEQGIGKDEADTSH